MSSAAAQQTAVTTANQAAAKATKAALAGAIDPWAGINVGIERHGQQIVLPERPVPMELHVAVTTLQRKIEEEEQVVGVNESVDAFPFDGAVAFQKAMKEMFGWVSAVPTPGFFGPNPPQTIDVKIGPKETMSVVWGRFELPGVEGFVQCGGYSTDEGPRFRISGEVKRKHHSIVVDLAKLTRRIAAEHSIYRGKAIELSVDNDGDVDWDDGIDFTDLSGVREHELVFSQLTEQQIKTNLWTLIEQTDRCRRHQVPLKRGILMEGRYGTGKSLTSAVTACKAVANGWTFLSINRVAGLMGAICFARKFQPAVIFAEDVDRVISGEERNTKIDDILETIDGIASKGTEIMVVLTTNHVEKMNRAMLRPGRLDAVITITPPDQQAVKKLIRLYGRELLAADDALEASSAMLDGQIPAIIRECTERAKLYAIGRTTNGDDDNLQITDQDVLAAAVGMKPHMELLEQKAEANRDPSFKEVLTEASKEAFATVTANNRSILRNQHSIYEQVGKLSEKVDEAVKAATSSRRAA